MRHAGLDIGSRTVKLAVIENGELVLSRKSVTSHDPLETARSLMKGTGFDAVTATGYGRYLIQGHLECPVISEIKAFAVGSRFFSSECRSILDIGGQDTKAISLDEEGNMSKFEMNDKCAAGTGRFLEVMATALGYTLEEFSSAALSAGLANSGSLKLVESGVELSRRAWQISKGKFLPTLMLIGSRRYEENGTDRYKFEASSQIMLTASLPLLPQLGNYASLRKAEFDYKKARLEARNASNGILLGTEAAVLNLVSSAQQVKASRLALDYTRQSYEQLQERFRMNLISSTELLDAELMLSSARLAYTNAHYAYLKNRLALMQSIGLENEQELDTLITSGVYK